MARPKKEGLDYFPMDCNFCEDENIMAVVGKFGLSAGFVAVRLLCTIYAKGYYARWTEPLRYKLTAVLPGMSEEQITEIVRQLAEWGFFSRELFEQEGVLTSEDIQRRYFEAVKRRNYPADMQYLLLEDVGADAAERGAKEKRAAAGKSAGKSARKTARKSEEQQVVNQPVNQSVNQPANQSVNPVNNDAVVVDVVDDVAAVDDTVDGAAVDDELDEIEARADAAAEEMRQAQARVEAEAALRAAAEAAKAQQGQAAQVQAAQPQGGASAGGSLSLVRGIPMMKRDTAWMRSAAQFVCKPSAEVCKLIDEFANNCRCQKIEQHKDLDDLERHFISWLKKCKGYNEAGGQGQVYGPQSPAYAQAYGQGGQAYGQGRGQAPLRAEDTIDERTRRMGYLLDRPERIHKDWSGGF